MSISASPISQVDGRSPREGESCQTNGEATTCSPRKLARGAFLGDDLSILREVWGPAQMARLSKWVELPDELLHSRDLESQLEYLSKVEVIFGTWNLPRLTSAQLDLMPCLKAVFYAAGSVKSFAQPLFDREIQVFSASAANAIPVAEFTLSQILFALKSGWQHHRQMREMAGPEGWKEVPIAGAYGSIVGIISLGMIGRKVCELLAPFRVKKLGFDPVTAASVFDQLDVRQTSLESVFSESNVVTLHAPCLQETEGMITGELLDSMKPYATFINTSRGRIVREEEMIEVLKKRQDLTAVLDVTAQEPPFRESPLYTLPNVVLLPHIAGSKGLETQRMADFMIEEYIQFQQGGDLQHQVFPDCLEHLA